MTQTASLTPAADRRTTLACLVPAMILPTCAALLYYVVLAGHPVATVLYALTKVFTVGWPILVALLIEHQRLTLRPAFRGARVNALPAGVLTGLIIGSAIVAAYHWTMLGDYAQAFTKDIRLKVDQMGIGAPSRYMVFCGFLALAHSLIEECFWRWYVFGRLSRIAPAWAAYGLAGLAFAGHHYVVLGCYFSPVGAFTFGTCVGIGGVWWCWMYRRQRTLAGCWISHAMVDIAIFAAGYDLLFA